jgi:hypothetical protein
MAIAGLANGFSRREQAEASRLAWAFAISVAFHLLVFGGYETGRKFNVWEKVHWPTWLQPIKKLAEALKKKTEPPVQPAAPPPLVFVDVSASQAVAEAPKDAKYYSDRNSRAANPKADKETDTPMIDGKQTEVLRTADVPQEKFRPLQPSPPAQPAQKPDKPAPPQEMAKAEPNEQEIKPKPALAPGDLTMAKPAPTPRTDEGNAEESKPRRPRTVAQALAQLQTDHLPGQKIKQDGGVKRRAPEIGFDVAASPFGAYDRALIEAISQRWYSLLDARDYASDGRGKVVLQFHLHYDGRITGLSISENTAGEMLGLLCEKAILDPSPFATWPGDMRRALGDRRSIQFTFYYE